MGLFFRQYGTGSPLIILHGLFGLSDNWVSIANKLALNHNVIIPDLRNHGRSIHSAEMNYNLMANDVIELCYNKKISKFSVLGHSMGGKVAITIAQKQPSLVEKIVIVDIGVGSTHKNADNIHLFVQQIRDLNIKPFRERSHIAKYLEEKGFNKSMMQLLLKNIYFSETGYWEWRFNIDAIHTNIDKIIAPLDISENISIPTLFVKGERSDYLDENAIKQIEKIFTAYSLVQIANSGHWVHADNPDGLIDEFKQFLK